jgi:HTH-type transcriptional regulator, sugar sensing transcriptional regulator
MIIKDEFLSRLRKIFDLNLYEAKVWTALLSRGVSTAGELSNISDVPRSRTYDILESLEKKGFIVMKIGKPIKFVALKPDEVVERVKKNLVVSAQEKSKRLEELKGDEVLSELSGLFENGVKFVEPSDLSGSLRGRQNMYNHLDMMVRSAEKSVTIATTEDGINRKMEALLPSLEKAKKRGVKLRIAAPITSNNIKVAKHLSKIADVRDTSSKAMKGRFAIVDSGQMMFMLTDDGTVHPNYDVAVWLSTDYFANVLDQMFELSWNEFTPLNRVKVKEPGINRK